MDADSYALEAGHLVGVGRADGGWGRGVWSLQAWEVEVQGKMSRCPNEEKRLLSLERASRFQVRGSRREVWVEVQGEVEVEGWKCLKPPPLLLVFGSQRQADWNPHCEVKVLIVVSCGG